MLNFYDFGGEDFPSLYLIYDTNLLQFLKAGLWENGGINGSYLVS